MQRIITADFEEFTAIKEALKSVLKEEPEFSDFEARKIEIGLRQMREGKTKTSEEVNAGARKVLGL